MNTIIVKAITIKWSESPDFETPRTFTDFESADQFLRELARNAPGPGGGYYKTDFEIEFEDGETYSGRYDLTNHETVDLARHVRQFAKFYSGRLMASELPSHLTSEQYREIVLRNVTQRDGLIRLLDGYRLGDPGILEVSSDSPLTKAE